MDFSRVQARGVSKLLLRGEKFSTPPNMKMITVLDQWRFANGRRVYLDASCLLLAADGRMIEAVDWSHCRSYATSIQGAVMHSGDQIDDAEGKGTHEITIKLDGLGEHPFQRPSARLQEWSACDVHRHR